MNTSPLSLAAIACLATSINAAEPTARDIAGSLDTFRRPDRSFEVRMTIRELRDGEAKGVASFHVFARRTPAQTRFDTLTLCLEPEADRNKVLLGRGSELWLYDPKSAKPVQIEPRRLRGKFWEIDVLGASFANDYEAERLPDGPALDASRFEHACRHVKLKLRDRSAPSPPTIEYWVDRESGHPVQGRFYSATGRLMRTAYYTEFASVLDVVRPTRGFVVSGVERGLVEDIKFTKLAHRNTPARYFTPEAMPEVSRGALQDR